MYYTSHQSIEGFDLPSTCPVCWDIHINWKLESDKLIEFIEKYSLQVINLKEFLQKEWDFTEQNDPEVYNCK